MTSLLLIEDSIRLAASLERGLASLGFEVFTAATGEGGRQLAALEDPQLLILDLGLPDMTGLDVLRSLRSAGNRSMVLVLSARSEVSDRVEALQAGADDYLVKPFAFDELAARLHALQRLLERPGPAVIQWNGVRVDLACRQATFEDKEIPLTAGEFAVLAKLLGQRGSVLTKDRIWQHARLRHSCHDDSAYSSNVVEVLVSAIRRKLRSAGSPCLIETRRGAGYTIPSLTPSAAL